MKVYCRTGSLEIKTLALTGNTEGSQVITVHGQERAVLLSAEAYQRLIQREGSLLDFFQRSPWAQVDLDVSRSGGTGREVEL